jgi:hypothetical protein
MSEANTLTNIFTKITAPEKRTKAGRPSAKKAKEYLIQQLRENDTFVVRTILKANFDEKITFPFPEGAPPFDKNKDEVDITDDMIRIIGSCVTFAKGLTVEKEKRFIDLLEKINEEDANLLILIKDRKFEEQFPTITKEVVKAVSPTMV